MLISVIIAIYSEKRLPTLMKAIKNHLNQSYKDKEIIIVVDNNEKVFNFLRRQKIPEIKIYLNTKDRGLSVARNMGINVSKGEIITFIDDDAIPHKLWLEKLAEKYQIEGIHAVGGMIKPMWVEIPWLPEELYWTIGCIYKGYPVGSNLRVRNVIGCNMSFRREALKKVGNFKRGLGRVGTNLIGGEETNICMRIIDYYGSQSVYFAPDALVWHVVESNRRNLPFFFRRAFSEGITKAWTNQFKKKNIDSKNNQPEMKFQNVERTYLHFLLNKAIPLRLKQLYSPLKISQLFLLVMSIFFVGLGYFYGHIILDKTLDQ